MATVQHMVVVKFKAGFSQQSIDNLFKELYEFWRTTPGVTYFAGGPNSSPEGLNQGYSHGFLVTFASASARDAYLTHPGHQRILERVLPSLDGVLAFDFEVPS